MPESKKLGEILVESGYLTPEQVGEVVEEQARRPDTPMGQICVDRGLITREQLQHLLRHSGKILPLGEMLLRAGRITRQQLDGALTVQRDKGGRLGEILVEREIIKEEILYETLSRQYNIPFVPLSHLEPDEELKAYVNPVYAAQNRIVPIARLGRRLTVAMVDPTLTRSVSDLAAVTRLEVEAVLATAEDVAQIYRKLYGRDPSEELAHIVAKRAAVRGAPGTDPTSRGGAAGAIGSPGGGRSGLADSAPGSDGGPGSDATPLPEDLPGIELDEDTELEVAEDPSGGSRSRYTDRLEDSPVTQTVVQTIISRALALRASDIHLEVDNRGPRVRFRIDGVLREYSLGGMDNFFRNNYRSVISRLKVMAQMDIAEKRRPQDGSIRIRTKRGGTSNAVDFRIATLPGRFGEGMTIRVLDQLQAPPSLESLGLTPTVLEEFRGLIHRSVGMILITGPTGSGKSSTLYAALRTVYNPGVKILTAEDPIEFTHPGICQAEVNVTIDNTFARFLRSFLRQDPDIIMVGEIRDKETAEMALRVAQTGHLLLSTLHTNNATGSIQRLYDLEMDANSIASSLVGVMAQRLVRKVCTRCAEPYVPGKSLLEEWFRQVPPEATWRRGAGCMACDHTGCTGRVAVSELWTPTQLESVLINKHASSEELRREVIKHMRTLGEDALLKAMDGAITLEEAFRVSPFDDVLFLRENGVKRVLLDLQEVRSIGEKKGAAEEQIQA